MKIFIFWHDHFFSMLGLGLRTSYKLPSTFYHLGHKEFSSIRFNNYIKFIYVVYTPVKCKQLLHIHVTRDNLLQAKPELLISQCLVQKFLYNSFPRTRALNLSFSQLHWLSMLKMFLRDLSDKAMEHQCRGQSQWSKLKGRKVLHHHSGCTSAEDQQCTE